MLIVLGAILVLAGIGAIGLILLLTAMRAFLPQALHRLKPKNQAQATW